MIKDKYKKLLHLIDQSTETQEVKLEDILSEAVVFFEELRKEFPKAPKEAKEEMVHMMSTLHSKLQAVSDKVAKETGLSDEDLNAIAEDPSNFTPEQWRLVQESKRKLYDSARKFSSDIAEQTPAGEGVKRKKRPVRARTRRSRRGQWKKT